MYPLEERLRYRKYVTPELTRQTPIYDWYSFPHSFSKELVHELLDEFEADQNSVILDPFVGAGTTLLACRERGIPAFGIDQLPFAVFTSNVKVRSYDAAKLREALDGFAPTLSSERPFGSVPTVDKAFSDEVRRSVAGIYGWTQSLLDRQADFFLLALSYILESISQTAKSGGWLRYVEKEVDPDSVDESFKARAQKMIEDVEAADLPDDSSRWYAVPGDARRISQSSKVVQGVISSPPYLNRHDYTRIFALEMALHFVETNRDLISIRHKAFRSHVEAKAEDKVKSSQYRATEELSHLTKKIEASCGKHDKRRVPSMIRGYFEDMYLTLDALHQQVSPGAKIAFVLGNVRYAGVMVPVDEIVAEIGEQVGLEVMKIIVARYTGNSAQQMAEYGRKPARESIIIWRKAD